MTEINTVMGPVSPDDLGITFIHEHMVYAWPGWECDTAAPPYNRDKIFKDCVESIEKAMKYGLKTFVDTTPNDGGRDPELYKMVADKTGINVICATGLFSEQEGSSMYFRNQAMLTGNPGKIVGYMCESFVKDITKGIGASGVKAGLLKIATSKGQITPYEKMVMQAAVIAQKETGVPLITHTEEGTMGPEQADFLIEQGVDVNRLMIGHMCNDSLPYHLEVLKKGPYIGFDRLGLNFYFPDDKRIEVIKALVRSGYEKQIMLSQDVVIHWPGREIVVFEAARPAVANWKLTHIFENILPALKKGGVTDDQIKTILVDNPRRLFTGAKS
jgi:phosphotriesterase-related protein